MVVGHPYHFEIREICTENYHPCSNAFKKHINRISTYFLFKLFRQYIVTRVCVAAKVFEIAIEYPKYLYLYTEIIF